MRQLHVRHEQGLPVLGARPRRVRVRQVQLPPRVQRARLPVPRGPGALYIERSVVAYFFNSLSTLKIEKYFLGIVIYFFYLMILKRYTNP